MSKRTSYDNVEWEAILQRRKGHDIRLKLKYTGTIQGSGTLSPFELKLSSDATVTDFIVLNGSFRKSDSEVLSKSSFGMKSI